MENAVIIILFFLNSAYFFLQNFLHSLLWSGRERERERDREGEREFD